MKKEKNFSIQYFLTFILVFVLTDIMVVQARSNIEGENNQFNDSIRSSESKTGNVITEQGAWCWFADPRALHYKNKSGTIDNTYIGYIDVHGNIKATQYNFNTNESNEVLVRSYFQPDDHNNPSFLVLPDERIMIFYSRHTDEACFYYRISKNSGDITSLGAELKIETKSNTTYPSPFILSSDPTHFYLCWRGINWHPTIARYNLPDEQDRVTLDWGPNQMIQSTAARPYCKYYSDGIDKIYLAYTTGHPDNEYPNYTYFNFIDINKLQLKDISGTVLSTIEEGPHSVNKSDYPSIFPKAVVDNPIDQRDWIWQTSIDKNGMPVIAMVQISEDKSIHNYYYVKWTGTEWRKTFLAHGGGHFHQSEGLELCYSGGMAIDDSNPNIVYCSVPVSGISGSVYEIMKYVLSDDGIVTSVEQVTYNSSLNNIRPFTVTNSGSNPLKLIWMYGNYYDWIVSSIHPEGFSTAIHSNFSFPEKNINLEKGLVIDEDFDESRKGFDNTSEGKLVSTKDSFTTFKVKNSENFSLSINLCINKDAYEGVILQIGNLKYRIDGSSLKPYVIVGDSIFYSNNLLGNSDSWQTQNRGTGGKWWPIVKLNYFNLTITCKDNLLTVYRDGLIDQVIEVTNLTTGDFILGGFEGMIDDCRIYNRALNQQEIETLIE